MLVVIQAPTYVKYGAAKLRSRQSCESVMPTDHRQMAWLHCPVPPAKNQPPAWRRCDNLTMVYKIIIYLCNRLSYISTINGKGKDYFLILFLIAFLRLRPVALGALLEVGGLSIIAPLTNTGMNGIIAHMRINADKRIAAKFRR